MRFGEFWWQLLLIAVGAYLIGNINPAILISAAKRKDIRKMGSGNPGMMNMSRNFGLGVGVIILVLDILKGVIPTLVASLIFGDKIIAGTTLPVGLFAKYLAGFSVVLGHIYPAVYRFKGGKGISSTIGVFLVCQWYIALIFGLIAIAFILVTRIGSMGSFLATTPPAIISCLSIYTDYYQQEVNAAFALRYYIAVNIFILAIVFLTWFAHRKNIEKLLSGEEHDTDWLQMLKDKFKRKNKKLQDEKNDKQEETAL